MAVITAIRIKVQKLVLFDFIAKPFGYKFFK
jgi:hypothetical protein